MATKKYPATTASQYDQPTDAMSSDQIAARDSMQVQVLRSKDESPVVIMCKMPRPGRSLSFSATIKRKGTDVQIDGAV